MRAIFFLLLFCSFTSLPPLYQGIKEIEAILQSKELFQYLSSADLIEEIVRIEGGYTILTKKKTVYIAVIPKKEKKIGPKAFELEFSYEPF